MIYLLAFSVSSFILMISDKKSGTKKRILAMIGLSIPILLATFRADTVGVDVGTYVKPMYECIKSSNSLSNYFLLIKSNISTKDLEWGFIIIGYIFGKFSNSLNGVFFIYELIIIASVYGTIVDFNKDIAGVAKTRTIPTWLGMFIFYTCFFNMSLTMVRQSTATSLVLYAVIQFISKKYAKSIFWCVCAVMMHNTAVFVIAILGLYYIVNNNRKVIKAIYWFFLLFFAIFGQRIYFVILGFISRFVHVSSRYLSSQYMDFTGNDLNLAWLYVIFISILITGLLYKKQKNNNIRKFLFCLMLTQFFLIPLSIISANAGRILYYYMYFTVVTIPLLGNAVKFAKRSQYSLIVMVYGLVYWTCTVGLNDITNTLTYRIGIY